MPAPEVEARVRAFSLIEEGRFRVIECDRTGRAVAHVDGRDGTVHRVARTPGGRLSCSCTAARFGAVLCAHKAALQLVCPAGDA